MDSSSPTISIIVPTYNSAKHIVAAIDSMLVQNLAPNEIVISDDGSHDDTLAILEGLRSKTSIPIHIHKNPSPSGLTNNYIHAASKTSGFDLIVVADHDDVWLPNRLSIIAAAFGDAPNSTVVCCDSYIANEDLSQAGQTLRGGYRKSVSLCNRLAGRDSLEAYFAGGLPWAAHSLSFCASLLPLIIRRPSHISDWYFEEFVVAMGATVSTVTFIPEALTLYRQHSNQTTKKHQPQAVSSKTGSTIPRTVDQGQLRMEKIRYCQSILQQLLIEPNTESDALKIRRLKLCQEALAYCASRSAWIESPAPLLRFAQQYLPLVLGGHYWRYGQGIRSMAADLLRYLKARLGD